MLEIDHDNYMLFMGLHEARKIVLNKEYNDHTSRALSNARYYTYLLMIRLNGSTLKLVESNKKLKQGGAVV